jgi:DNA (cytosine-5)-methyltransferase 1
VRLVGAVEREAYAASILAAGMVRGDLDLAPIWSDVATFDGRPWRGRVDLVTAGYPCQGESLAGNGRGVDDERWLWPHVMRIVDECGARFLFCENVAGHISRSFRVVLGDLAARGWSVEWDLVPASTVGAPHIRERVFFLAVAPDADRDELRIVTERDQRDRRRVRATERESPVALDDGQVGHALDEWDLDIAADARDAGGFDPDRAPGEAWAPSDADGERPQVERNGGQLDEGKREARGRDARRRGREGSRHAGPLDEFHERVREQLEAIVAAGREFWTWERAPEPVLLGMDDGTAATMDRAARDEDERLAAIGNGVVPFAAAFAFVVLWHRHFGGLPVDDL